MSEQTPTIVLSDDEDDSCLPPILWSDPVKEPGLKHQSSGNNETTPLSNNSNNNSSSLKGLRKPLWASDETDGEGTDANDGTVTTGRHRIDYSSDIIVIDSSTDEDPCPPAVIAPAVKLEPTSTMTKKAGPKPLAPTTSTTAAAETAADKVAPQAQTPAPNVRGTNASTARTGPNNQFLKQRFRGLAQALALPRTSTFGTAKPRRATFGTGGARPCVDRIKKHYQGIGGTQVSPSFAIALLSEMSTTSWYRQSQELLNSLLVCACACMCVYVCVRVCACMCVHVHVC